MQATRNEVIAGNFDRTLNDAFVILELAISEEVGFFEKGKAREAAAIKTGADWAFPTSTRGTGVRAEAGCTSPGGEDRDAGTGLVFSSGPARASGLIAKCTFRFFQGDTRRQADGPFPLTAPARVISLDGPGAAVPGPTFSI